MKVLLADSLPETTIQQLTALGIQVVNRPKLKAEELAGAIDDTPGLRLLARPDATLVAFAADDPGALDVYAVADALWRREWYVDRQGPPASLHCTVNAVHDGLIPAFVHDLRDSVREVLAAASTGGVGAYGTIE